MLDQPEIVQTSAQPAAIIRFTIPRSEIREIMGPAMGELKVVVAAQGICPSGPLFSHHLRMSPDVFDFELGLPVARPVRPSGRVEPGELPAAVVARTIYRGPYEGLGEGWSEFCDWIEAEGHTMAPDLWECYVSGPENDADHATWATELNRPLIALRS